MNATFPCNECKFIETCSDECGAYVNYFRRIIRSYARYGNRSKLMKAARKQLSFENVYRIKRGIDNFFNIKVKRKISGNWYIINRKGTLVEHGSATDIPMMEKMFR
jgi:hypothetical protein